MKILLLILFFFAMLPLHAQVFKGRVVEEGSRQPLYPVTVVNIRTQQATYTTVQGSFVIQAEPGDRVAFSYVGYKTVEYKVPFDKSEVDVAMERMSYQLQEVILMPGFTQYQIDSIERVKTYRPFLTRTKSSPISSPFSFVAEKFNKRSKQIFKFQKKFGEWEDERFIDTRYTPELVHEMTGLTEDSIGYFMNTYPMPYDYARAATDLEMKMWIREHYRKWLKEIDTAGIPIIIDTVLKKP